MVHTVIWIVIKAFRVILKKNEPPPKNIPTCFRVGKFTCEKNFLGRVELGEDKVTEKPL